MTLFPSPVPFFWQETESSCTVACLRMVLAHFGTAMDEAVLRECCRNTGTGTRADDAAACARRYGFRAEHLRRNRIEDLRDWLAGGYYPIALLNLFPLTAHWVLHAVVVIALDAERVTYLDPARGRRADSLVAFEQAWQMNLARVLLIQP
ncbi:MAG: C39 family peptidase [Chloroflexi bacterium]|nr:C39 family peptidase [Chloroflexota bacterium]